MQRYFKLFIRAARLVVACICVCSFVTACHLFDDDDGNETKPETKTMTARSSDWLFVLYADADNNLNDDIWTDMFNAERALAAMRNSDGSAAAGYPSVRMVMLWDGESRAGASEFGNTRIHPDAALYELNAIDDATYNAVNAYGLQGLKTWTLGTNAENLTEYASWLTKEPDMGDVRTLTSFLSWVNTYYSADNVVLMLSDHGAGTEYEAVSGGYDARSLCADDTNADLTGTGLLLTATDVKSAIVASGLKPNIIWMDCCLQGNVETTYILRGCADYLVSSPNLSYSNDWYHAVIGLKSGSTPLSYGGAIIAAYADKFDNFTMSYSPGYRASFDTMFTQVQYDLSVSKQNALYNAINALSDALIADGDTVVNAVYDSYLVQNSDDYDACKGMAFCGTYMFENDIGYFCKNLIADTDCGVSEATKTAAQTVMDAVGDIVVTAWLGKTGVGESTENGGEGYYTVATDYIWYQKNTPGFTDETILGSGNGTFGLTIGTQPFYSFGSYKRMLTAYQATTGYCKGWENLLNIWLSDED